MKNNNININSNLNNNSNNNNNQIKKQRVLLVENIPCNDDKIIKLMVLNSNNQLFFLDFECLSIEEINKS